MEVLLKSTDSRTVEVIITEKRGVFHFDTKAEGYTELALKMNVHYLNDLKSANGNITLYDALNAMGINSKQCKMCIFFGWEEDESIEIDYLANDETLTLYFNCKIL